MIVPRFVVKCGNRCGISDWSEAISPGLMVRVNHSHVKCLTEKFLGDG